MPDQPANPVGFLVFVVSFSPKPYSESHAMVMAFLFVNAISFDGTPTQNALNAGFQTDLDLMAHVERTAYQLTDGHGAVSAGDYHGWKPVALEYRSKGSHKQVSYGRYTYVSLLDARDRHTAAGSCSQPASIRLHSARPTKPRCGHLMQTHSAQLRNSGTSTGNTGKAATM